MSIVKSLVSQLKDGMYVRKLRSLLKKLAEDAQEKADARADQFTDDRSYIEGWKDGTEAMLYHIEVDIGTRKPELGEDDDD